MSMVRRLQKLEAAALERTARQVVDSMPEADHLRMSMRETLDIVKGALALTDRYSHLAIPQPDGTLDIDPVIRAVAVAEGIDPDEAIATVERILEEHEGDSD